MTIDDWEMLSPSVPFFANADIAKRAIDDAVSKPGVKSRSGK